jgi:hypothetical protein
MTHHAAINTGTTDFLRQPWWLCARGDANRWLQKLMRRSRLMRIKLHRTRPLARFGRLVGVVPISLMSNSGGSLCPALCLPASSI